MNSGELDLEDLYVRANEAFGCYQDFHYCRLIKIVQGLPKEKVARGVASLSSEELLRFLPQGAIAPPEVTTERNKLMSSQNNVDANEDIERNGPDCEDMGDDGPDCDDMGGEDTEIDEEEGDEEEGGEEEGDEESRNAIFLSKYKDQLPTRPPSECQAGELPREVVWDKASLMTTAATAFALFREWVDGKLEL